MNPKKDPYSAKESHNSESNSVEVRVVDSSTNEVLDAEVGMVGEQVGEVASENASEQAKGGKKKDDRAQKATKKRDPAFEEHIMLREKLLATAPEAREMRSQVESILLTKKSHLESSISRLSRGTDFDLLSRTIAELRLVVHQISLAAHASYEVLKEIWLRVVHKFA